MGNICSALSTPSVKPCSIPLRIYSAKSRSGCWSSFDSSCLVLYLPANGLPTADGFCQAAISSGSSSCVCTNFVKPHSLLGSVWAESVPVGGVCTSVLSVCICNDYHHGVRGSRQHCPLLVGSCSIHEDNDGPTLVLGILATAWPRGEAVVLCKMLPNLPLSAGTFMC